MDCWVRREEEDEWFQLKELHEALTEKASKETPSDSNNLLGCGCLLVIFLGLLFGGMSVIGLGFLFIPLLMLGVLYLIYGFILGLIFNVDVFSAKMWSIHETPSKDSFMQFLAMMLALTSVLLFYLWRFGVFQSI